MATRRGYRVFVGVQRQGCNCNIGGHIMSFWCVVQTETSREFLAARYLKRAGYEAYVPRLSIRRKGEERIEPLFPSYLFAETEENNWSPIRWTVAVVRIVMDGPKP